jgi:iron complex outermembrane receptor protein
MKRCAQGGRRLPHACPPAARTATGLSPCALACALLFAGWTAPSRAQTEEPAALEAVTVRARFVDEAVRDVPFSVDVLTGTALEERGLYSLEDALRTVPGVEINSYGDTLNTNVRIRGMGALQKVSGEDSSVTISVDGLAVPLGDITSSTFDLERIEVLKGPQGTLFGSNSEAGAINIITRKPTRHFEGYLRSEIGQQGQRMLEGAVSGPLSETLSGRIAWRASGADHQVRDEASGEPVARLRDGGLRASLLWQPTGLTRVTLSAQHDRLRHHPSVIVMRPYGDRPSVVAQPYTDQSWKNGDRLSAELVHDLGPALLTAVTGYSRSTELLPGNAYEGTLYRQLLGMEPEGRFAFDHRSRLLSQELRLSSRPAAPVFWVMGLNWRHSDRNMDVVNAYDGFYPESPYNAGIQRRLQSSSHALFGEATWPLARRLKLTAGLRHTWERKRHDAYWQALDSNPSALREAEDHHSLRDNYTTGRVALNWAATQQTNLYAVAARGYKSAGYNDSGTNIASGGSDLPYAAARVLSFELGFKSESADGRLGLNGALFHNRARGDHLLIFNTVSFATQAENFDTRSQGAELSGYWKPGGGLTFTGGLALTHARITGIPAGSSAGAAVGNRVPDSPRWSANLSVAHRMPLKGFLGLPSPTLNTLLTSRIVGQRAADTQNHFMLPRYHQLDLRMGVSSGNAEFYVWANNLLDKRYDLYGYYYAPMYDGGPSASVGTPSRGRSLGVGFAYYF